MPAGDSYIIRIYRRCRGKPMHVVGVVEQVRSGKKMVFHNVEELWAALAPQRSGRSEARREDRATGGEADGMD